MDINERIASADSGNVIDQYLVGRAYEEGTAIQQNYSLAEDYYFKASNGGHIQATLALAKIKSLSVKLKVTFEINGYRNGRRLTDAKKYVIDLKESSILSSYNSDEVFIVNRFFLDKVYLKRTSKGEESEVVITKGHITEIEESSNALSYKYTFEIVFSSDTLIDRDPFENKILLDLDHQQLEKEIFYLCVQKDPKINPYRHDIGAVYWPAKKQILKERYNIDWKSPIELVNGDYDIANVYGACEIDQEYWWTLL